MLVELDLSIIIVNWKSSAFVRACLSSIYENDASLTIEIIVVDNASRDGCEQMVRTEFPGVRFVQSDENLGFASANNLGFHHASGRVLLFLNPDTEIKGNAIQSMAEFLKATPAAGIAGPKLLNTDGSIQTSCIRKFPKIINQLLDSEYLERRFPRLSLWGAKPLFEDSLYPVPVEAVSGAALMIRREVFEAVGLFTSCYFMYAEDMDLCFKVKQSGWSNYFVPAATVIHHGGKSSGSKDGAKFAVVVMRESRLKFFRKRRGAFYAAIYRATTGCAAFCRLILLGGLFLSATGRARRNSLRVSFWKWTAILRWSVGMEQWSKQPK